MSALRWLLGIGCVAVLILLVVTQEESARAADFDCADFTTQAEAQKQLLPGDPYNLDGNEDGIACNALPCPCAEAGDGGGDSPSVPKARRLRALVLRVVDGDTLEVRILRTSSIVDARLIGIDTPETKRPGTPVECGGPGASRSMSRMADGRVVTLVTDPTQDRIDRYGRLLAYAIRGGVDLNRAQIRRGWAETYVYNDNPFRRAAAYQRSEEVARAKHRGVWGWCGGNFHTGG